MNIASSKSSMLDAPRTLVVQPPAAAEPEPPLVTQDGRIRADGYDGTVDAAQKDRRPNLHPAAARKHLRIALPATTPLKEAVKPVQLKVPWYGEMSKGHGYRAGWAQCFQAAKAMGQGADRPGTAMGPEERIQVARAEAGAGRIVADTERACEGRDYISGELRAGRPVVVGVSHHAGLRRNADGITDHFVTITGCGTDKDGNVYYTFNDPGTTNPDIGADTNPRNRFLVDAKTGILYRDGDPASPYVTERRYEVSMVRRNQESQEGDLIPAKTQLA
jgi:hypothetical protein